MASNVLPVCEVYKGIPVNLDQLEAAIYVLAGVFHGSLEKASELYRRAKHMLTNHPVTHRESGEAVFACYFDGSDPDVPSPGVEISAHSIAREQYVLSIDGNTPQHGPGSPLEVRVAGELNLTRALQSVTATVPLELVDPDLFRWNLRPFISGLGRLDLRPYFPHLLTAMTGEAAVHYLEDRLGAALWSGNSLNLDKAEDWQPTWAFRSQSLPLLVKVGLRDSQLVRTAEDQLRLLFWNEGPVLTGHRALGEDGELQSPHLVISVTHPSLVEGHPYPLVLGDALVRTATRRLAEDIAALPVR